MLTSGAAAPLPVGTSRRTRRCSCSYRYRWWRVRPRWWAVVGSGVPANYDRARGVHGNGRTACVTVCAEAGTAADAICSIVAKVGGVEELVATGRELGEEGV